MTRSAETGARRAGIKLGIAYFVIAAAWVLLSDRAVEFLAGSAQSLAFLQSFKGVAFVAVMAVLLGGYAARLQRVESARLREQLLASFDPVTRLPISHSFYEELAEQLRHCEQSGGRCAVMLLDFRDFARINDGFGRAAGDQVLQNVARRLQALPRAPEVIARLEKDKFALIIEDADDADVPAAIAEEIGVAFRREMTVDDNVVLLDYNISYAIYPEDGDSVSALIDAAELTLRAAKRIGANVAERFRPSLLHTRRRHFHIESELRHALNHQGLSLHLQPQFDLASNALIGAEALARWTHADHGPISPGVFIPVAEQTGLIDRISEFVMDRVCQALHEWRGRGLPEITVAVNVAGHQLDDGRLGFFLQKAAEEWNAPLHQLEIEVTESMAMRDPDQAVDGLSRLREMGVSIALGDFGTGYSSLSHLLRLPVNKLKIDRSFITDLPENRQQLGFVRTMVALGDELGVTLLAEGIETDAQRQHLLAIGCRHGQGFLLGRPMEIDAFADLLARSAATTRPEGLLNLLASRHRKTAR